MANIEPAVLHELMKTRFGSPTWWPADTKFEIFVGAILTQQTTWSNVEKAIHNLKINKSLDIAKISSMRITTLQRLIRPSGFYKQKALRLKSICTRIAKEYGTLDKLFSRDKHKLKKILLSMKGIGNETADSIILYAAEKPTFVIDAYTKRIMNRVDPKIRSDIGYDQLKSYFEDKMKPDTKLYKEFHAQFVELAKRHCKTKPICKECPLEKICHYAASQE